MAFDQSTITSASAVPDGAELLVTWTSSAAAGTLFQLYVDGVLAWHGTARSTMVPMPAVDLPTQFNVGTVGSSEGLTDFSADLPAPSGGGARVTLKWPGGTYLGADIAGYHVYMGTVAGGAVSYTTPVATVSAYTQGIVTSGYGMGGYGAGGYGASAGTYSWTSGPLTGGVWNFGVKSFDVAGNEGAPVTSSATVAAPPNPPARNTAGKRLTYTYSASTHEVTLNWLASP